MEPPEWTAIATRVRSPPPVTPIRAAVRAELTDAGEDCRPLFDAVLKRISPLPG